jgi:phage terminase small subunit
MALTERQTRFLEAYACHGIAAKAARETGYSDKSEAAKVTAHRVLKKPEAQEYLHNLLLKALSTHAPYAVKVIRDLAEHAESEAVKLQACKELLDRAGFTLAQKHEIIVTDQRSTEEIEASIRAHAEELGLHHVIEGEVLDVAKVN